MKSTKVRARLLAAATLTCACVTGFTCYETLNAQDSATKDVVNVEVKEMPDTVWSAIKSDVTTGFTPEKGHLPRDVAEPIINEFAERTGLVLHERYSNTLEFHRVDGAEIATVPSQGRHARSVDRVVQRRYDEDGNAVYRLYYGSYPHANQLASGSEHANPRLVQVYRMSAEQVEEISYEYLSYFNLRHPLFKPVSLNLGSVELQTFLQTNLYRYENLQFAATQANRKVLLRLEDKPLMDVIEYAIQSAGGTITEYKRGKAQKDIRLFYDSETETNIRQAWENRASIVASGANTVIETPTDALLYRLSTVETNWDNWSGMLVVHVPN